MKETYLPIMRCPVYRRRDSNLGPRAELENLADDDKGKGASGGPTRPKVLKRQLGADCFVIALKWGRMNREVQVRICEWFGVQFPQEVILSKPSVSWWLSNRPVLSADRS
jgi:hypothetical protein